MDRGNIPKGKSCVYKCLLPGLSITDILEARNKPAFYHINFTKPEIQHAFKALRNEGMLRPIAFSPNGELRYDVYDPSVKMFLEDCWELYNEIYSITELIWKKIRRPTADEIKWLELLRGTQTANKIRRNTYEHRHKHFMKFKNKKLYIEKIWPAIIKYNDTIKGRILNVIKEEYAEVIKKYQFPFDDLLEIIYPKFLQQLSP